MPKKGYKKTEEHKAKAKQHLQKYFFKKGIDERRFQIVGKSINTNRSRNNHLKKYYGITHEEYEVIFKKQDGRCAICGSYQDIRKLAVDHNHITGKIRGLLCTGCNVGIGSLKENKQILENAIKYLDLNK